MKTLAEHINFRKAYIEGFAPILNAFAGFDSIDYAWSIKDKSEYIRVADTISEPAFFDVTGLRRPEMAIELFKYFDGSGSERLITDPEKKMMIAKLIKEGRKR
jgi:hypothetical protein